MSFLCCENLYFNLCHVHHILLGLVNVIHCMLLSYRLKGMSDERQSRPTFVGMV